MNINHGISISYTDCCKAEAPAMSTEPKLYIEKNTYQSSLCAAVWVSIVSSVSQRAADVLSDHIIDFGLLDAIKMCQDDVSAILAEDTDPDILHPVTIILLSDASISDTLQCLRFPKRFTPVDGSCDLLYSRAISSFKQLLNSVKLVQRREFSSFVVGLIRYEVHKICEGYKSDDLYVDGYFSSGGVSDGNRSLYAKVGNWSEPNFGHISYPNLHQRHANYNEFAYDWYGTLVCNDRSAKLLAVPKSYKTPRLIAEEDSTRQWYLQAINTRLRRCIKDNGYADVLPLENQPHNQLLAMLGSCDKTYATIDLSSASDSIPVSLFKDVFPTNVVSDIMQYRSSTINIDGRPYIAQMLATSGSGVCFVTEAILFYAITNAATTLVERMTGEELMPCAAMGDDIVCDVRAYETVCEFLTHFGFTVNGDKSFTGDHPFRESCGKDYYAGTDVTSVYWPREAIRKHISCVPSLIALHNRLFLNGYYDAARILQHAITGIAGRRLSTTRYQDFVNYDPFDTAGYVTTCKTALAPYSATCDEPHYNEVHDMVKYVPVVDRNKHVDSMYYYTQYLLHGPLYMSPLDELLGVTVSRVRDDDVSYKGNYRVVAVDVF